MGTLLPRSVLEKLQTWWWAFLRSLRSQIGLLGRAKFCQNSKSYPLAKFSNFWTFWQSLVKIQKPRGNNFVNFKLLAKFGPPYLNYTFLFLNYLKIFYLEVYSLSNTRQIDLADRVG